MKSNPHDKLRTQRLLQALLAGLLVGLISMAGMVGAVQAQTGDTPTPAPADATAVAPAAAPTEAPKACAECHPNVNDAWTASPHAHAYDNPEFVARWGAAGQPGQCLTCHTTGYQANSGSFTAEGVTCEGCHGEANAEHPPAMMPVRSDSEYCGTCHVPTLNEWRLTGHAAAGVGCADCHNPHSQQARFENPDEMCVNCHKDDLGEHKDDLHIEKGITCVQCHTLTLPPETPPIDGLVPTGHMFTITAHTCVACHSDTLKIGRALPGYEAGAAAGAAAINAAEPISRTLPGVIAHYIDGPSEGPTPAQQIQALEASLASTRLSTLFQGGIVGLVLGGTTAYFVARNGRRHPEEELVETEQEQPNGQG